MQCVILAGGLATRLRPITETIPKALVEVRGEPFVDLQLAYLAKQGVTEAVFCIGYRGEQLARHVGDGARWGLRARYVDEGTDLRGTGGALRLALDEGALAPEFLVLYGDSFLPIDFRAVWESFLAGDRAALMTVFRNGNRWDRSNARYADGQVTLYDKHYRIARREELEYLDYGLSAFRRETIARGVPAGGKADLAEIFHALSLRGELAGYEVFERFYEIGSVEGIADLEAWLNAAGPAR